MRVSASECCQSVYSVEYTVQYLYSFSLLDYTALRSSLAT